MGQENNLESEANAPSAGGPEPTGDEVSESSSLVSVDPKGMTPGQRLAAKRDKKALHKKELKEELKRKEEEARAAEEEEARRIFATPDGAALPGEVEHVAEEFTGYVQSHSGRILAVIAGVVGLGVAAIYAKDMVSSGSAEQAGLFAAAVEIANAPIDESDADGKTDDGKPVFKTREARATKAEEAFSAAAKNEPGTVASDWAKLAEASVASARGQLDQAKKLFEDVYAKRKDELGLGTRALEGVAMMTEAQGDLDAAQKRYEELATLQGGIEKDLAEYHLARLKLEKGDSEGAKTMLKALYERLGQPGEEDPKHAYIKGEVEVRLAELDSSLVQRSGGGTDQLSSEELQRIIQRLQQQQGQAGE